MARDEQEWAKYGDVCKCGEGQGTSFTNRDVQKDEGITMKKRFSLGERIVGVGMITQAKIFKNREKKVYGRVFGNKQ